MPGEPQGHRIVVFIDMLGFSRLVNDFDGSEPIGGFRDFSGGSLEDLDRQLRYAGHPLERQFSAFHGVTECHSQRITEHDAPHSVTFSDSAFIAFHFPIYAYRFAVDVMRDLIIRRTPVRMGIAMGSFRSRRFASDVTESVRRHSFQFFGTGVVGAYEAEKCGLKGMRILLHPNLTLTDDSVFSQITDPTDSQRPLKTAVTHELNYVGEYARFMRFPGERDDTDFDPEALAVQVRMMAQDSSSDADVQLQYQRTSEAIARMRGAPRRTT